MLGDLVEHLLHGQRNLHRPACDHGERKGECLELDVELEALALALSMIARRPVKVDRKSTRLNSSHLGISYAVFCLKKKKQNDERTAEQCSHVGQQIAEHVVGSDKVKLRGLDNNIDRAPVG